MTEQISDQVDWEARYHELKRSSGSQFAIRVAAWIHDARGFLTSGIGYIEMLKRSGLDPDQCEQIVIVQQSLLDINTLFEQVLTRTKLEAGEIRPNKLPFSIRELVQSLMMRYQLKAQLSGLILDHYISSDCPQFLVGDQLLIQRVLSNLVDNAIKYTNDGGVYVFVTYNLEERRLLVSVKDTGIGINPDDQTRIFRIFQQSDHRSLSSVAEGFGLGLYICCELTSIMDGTIDVKSELERGSTFTVELPLPPKT